MNKYINTKTGAIIETECVIKGENWKTLKGAKPKKKAEKEDGKEESGE